MITAALVSFAILLIAWIVAPSGSAHRAPDVASPADDLLPEPMAEAA